jgi:hypothetical protein
MLYVQDSAPGQRLDRIPYNGAAYPELLSKFPLRRQPVTGLQLPSNQGVGDLDNDLLAQRSVVMDGFEHDAHWYVILPR